MSAVAARSTTPTQADLPAPTPVSLDAPHSQVALPAFWSSFSTPRLPERPCGGGVRWLLGWATVLWVGGLATASNTRAVTSRWLSLCDVRRSRRRRAGGGGVGGLCYRDREKGFLLCEESFSLSGVPNQYCVAQTLGQRSRAVGWLGSQRGAPAAQRSVLGYT